MTTVTVTIEFEDWAEPVPVLRRLLAHRTGVAHYEINAITTLDPIPPFRHTPRDEIEESTR